jgi:hypothetical protein
MGTFSFSFHWPPSGDLTSPPFSSSLKGGFGSWEVFFSPNIIFNSILKILIPTSFLRRKRMISLGSWEKEGEYNGNLVIVLKEWRWVVIVLGGWDLKEISQTFLGFVT